MCRFVNSQDEAPENHAQTRPSPSRPRGHLTMRDEFQPRPRISSPI